MNTLSCVDKKSRIAILKFNNNIHFSNLYTGSKVTNLIGFENKCYNHKSLDTQFDSDYIELEKLIESNFSFSELDLCK